MASTFSAHPEELVSCACGDMLLDVPTINSALMPSELFFQRAVGEGTTVNDICCHRLLRLVLHLQKAYIPC